MIQLWSPKQKIKSIPSNWLFFSLYDFHAESFLADYVNVAKDKLFPEPFYQD